MLGRKGKGEKKEGVEGNDGDESLSPPLGEGEDLFEEDQDLAGPGTEGHADGDRDVIMQKGDLERTPIAAGRSSVGRIKASPGSWGAGMVRRADDMRSKKEDPDTPTMSTRRSVAGGLLSTHLRKDPTPGPLRCQRDAVSPSSLSRKSRAKSTPAPKSKKKDFIAPWSESEGSDEGQESIDNVLLPETQQSAARNSRRKTTRSYAATPRTPVASSTPPRLTSQPASPGPALDHFDPSESIFVTGYTPDSSRRSTNNAQYLPWSPSPMNTLTPSATRNSGTTPSQALRKENHDPSTSTPIELDFDVKKLQTQPPLATPRKEGIAKKPAPKRARETSPGEAEANKKAAPELVPPAAPALRGAAAAGRKKGVARKVRFGRK